MAQVHSPITFQDDGGLPQARPNSSVYSNLQLRPGQLDAANLQPQFAPNSPDHPIMSGDLGQDIFNIPTFVQSPNPYNGYVWDPTHPLTVAQKVQFERLGYRYPVPRDPFPIISPAVQEAETNASTNSSYCECGPGCNCLFCAVHPYNDATRARVQDLTQIMVADDYWSLNHLSPPQSGHGVAPTDGTSIASGMGQDYPQLDDVSFPSATLGLMDTPISDPALQPTVDEGAPNDNGGHSNQILSRTMQASEYINLEYRVSASCTAVPGTCLCGSDCGCLGCLTHQGHNQLPN